MNRIVTTAIALLVMSTEAVFAQKACLPEQLNEKFDRYARQPFSALNWRVMIGLGDPGVEPSGGYESWENQDEYKKLVQRVLKLPEPPDTGFECRTGYPLAVLKRHIAQFGENDTYTVQWAKVQQQVFMACSQNVSQQLADPLVGIDQAREQAQREDRAYQLASVAFYTDKARAVQLFRTIGASSSSHRAAARYNVANLLANAKQLDEARKEANAILADPSLTSVHTITKELLGYIANLEDTAAGWMALIDDASATLVRPTADIDASPDHRTEFARALSDIDYAGIRSKEDDWWLRGELPENPTISKAIVDATRKSPMALWMVGGQSLNSTEQRLGWALRGDRWQSFASSFEGRVEAIAPAGSNIPPLPLDVLRSMTAKADAASAPALWSKVSSATQKAQESCGSAPETAALPVYLEQAVRASANAGDFRKIYDALIGSPVSGSEFVSGELPRRLMAFLLASGNSAEGRKLRDELLSPQRLAVMPENIRSSFTETANRFKAWVAEDEAAWRSAVLDLDASSSSPLLNLLPTENLWSLGTDQRFSAAERSLFARVAWTRSYAQGRGAKRDTLERLLSADDHLKATFEKTASEFPKLANDRLQLLFVLRNPRLGILVNAPNDWEQTGLALEHDASYDDVNSGDHNDRNWWCPLELDRHLGAIRQALYQDAEAIEPSGSKRALLSEAYDPVLLDRAVNQAEALLRAHPVVRSADWKLLQRLARVPSAPKRLTEAAIAWAKTSDGQDGAPEALALAIGTTKSGCNWHGGHGKYSKAAQTLLKSRFPKHPLATEVQYWFDCMRNEWDNQGNRLQTCEVKTWPKQRMPR